MQDNVEHLNNISSRNLQMIESCYRVWYMHFENCDILDSRNILEIFDILKILAILNIRNSLDILVILDSFEILDILDIFEIIDNF